MKHSPRAPHVVSSLPPEGALQRLRAAGRR